MLCIAASVAASWIARGIYDDAFMMNGHIHVISRLSGDHSVTLEFPSGEKRELNLKESGSTDLEVLNTGEGSISVFVDGELIDQVGYVTSMNNPIVLCVSEEAVGFSQIFKK